MATSKPRIKFTISREAHARLQNAAAAQRPRVTVSFLLEVLIRKHLDDLNPAEDFNVSF